MAEGRTSILVIGIGTELRGDDEAGLLVLRGLRAQAFPDSVRFLECSNDGVNLIDAWKDSDEVIVIDAVSAGLPPGTIITTDLREDAGSVPMLQSSTHRIGLLETIRLARVLGTLPPALLLYGIQGKTFRPGEAISPEVLTAIDRVVGAVSVDLQQWCGTGIGDTGRILQETKVTPVESNRKGLA